MNAFDELMAPASKKRLPPSAAAPPPKQPKVTPVDVLVWAVIYVRRLVNVPDDDVLKGTPYFGQSVRGGFDSALATARVRWKDENSDGRRLRYGKKGGLILALHTYGRKAFRSRVLESKYGPRDEVQAWADEREQALIDENGGRLRDMDPPKPIHQCFNVAKGGKGAKWWKGKEACCAKLWKRFKSELQAYVDEFGTAYVPNAFVSKSNYKLGAVIVCVRCTGIMLKGRPEEAERRAWLESLPRWTWRAKQSEEYRTKKGIESKKRRQDQDIADRIAASFAVTSAKKKKARLLVAHEKALPYEPVKANRVKGQFYHLEDGSVGRWDGNKWGVHHGQTRDKEAIQEAGKRARQMGADAKKRARLVDARAKALPYEPVKANRIKGQNYHREDGTIVRWDGCKWGVHHGQTRDKEAIQEAGKRARQMGADAKKRARLVDARAKALPYEPVKANRVKGQFYHRLDGNIGRWCGFKLSIVGPAVDPIVPESEAGPSGVAPDLDGGFESDSD